MERLVIAATLLLLAAPARSDVYYVDDNGGPSVDFNDLPPAVAAAVPGDVLFVLGGHYSATVLDEGIRIVGLGTAAIHIHGLRVQALPRKQVAAIVNAQIFGLVVDGCGGTVVLDNVWMRQEAPFDGSPGGLVVDSADVRVFRSLASPGAGVVPAAGLEVRNSRIEFVESDATGWSAPDAPCYPGDGEVAVRLVLGARALFADPTYINGGYGGSLTQICTMCNPNGSSGDGAPAIAVGAATELLLTGRATSGLVLGGSPGLTSDPNCVGRCGPAIRAHVTALVRWAGIDLLPGLQCAPGTPAIEGPFTQEPSIPFLDLQEPATPNGGARFVVWGEPGDSVELVLGSLPLLVATPGVEIERLTTEDRRIPMGAITPAGNVSLLLPLPCEGAVGVPLWAQAEVSTSGGLVRTNSQVLIVR